MLSYKILLDIKMDNNKIIAILVKKSFNFSILTVKNLKKCLVQTVLDDSQFLKDILCE